MAGFGIGNGSSGGFWDDVMTNMKMYAITEASKDEFDRPDPAVALGMAVGSGHHSFDDLMRLGVALGTEGAFDSSSSDNMFANDDSFEVDVDNDADIGVYGDADGICNDEDIYSDGEEFFEEEFVSEDLSTPELNPVDLPTKRAYEVASWLEWMQERDPCEPIDECDQKRDERCVFIRDNPDLIAAKYLTCEGNYLYAQAVKDHFTLPFDVQDEDLYQETYLNDLIMDTIEFDEELALDIWLWCIREFYPYQRYNYWTGDAVTCMQSHLVDCPQDFLNDLVSKAMQEELVCQALTTAAEDCSCMTIDLVLFTLRAENTVAAETFFSTYISGEYASDEDVCHVIEGIICGGTGWEEKETLELVRDRIFPIAAEYPKNARVINRLEKWTKQVNEHIEAVESSAEKYAYSGRFVWRTTCADGSEYNLDPLDYETEEEYNEALYECKYYWRKDYADTAATYELDVNAYETVEEFRGALSERIRQQQVARQEQRKAEKRQTEAQRRSPDPLAATDKTVYPFCGVVFLNSEEVYHYRIQDASLAIGDLVIAPVGKENRHLVAEIVSLEQHTRRSAPFPVDKTKFIVGRYVEEK